MASLDWERSTSLLRKRDSWRRSSACSVWERFLRLCCFWDLGFSFSWDWVLECLWEGCGGCVRDLLCGVGLSLRTISYLYPKIFFFAYSSCR